MKRQVKKLDTLLSKLESKINDTQAAINALEHQGYLNVYPHYKTGTKAMYLWHPMQDGKRRYEYIGVDQEKQQAVFEKIERYKQRQQLLIQLRQLENHYSQALHQIEHTIEFLSD